MKGWNCVLFYGSETLWNEDIILNYGLIACYTIITFYPLLISLQVWQKLLLTILFVMIQAVMWICLDVCGVSLIWSGQFGLISHYLRSENNWVNNRRIFVIGVFLGSCVLTYYAIYFPIITTLAHAIAMFVGFIITLRVSRLRN